MVGDVFTLGLVGSAGGLQSLLCIVKLLPGEPGKEGLPGASHAPLTHQAGPEAELCYERVLSTQPWKYFGSRGEITIEIFRTRS